MAASGPGLLRMTGEDDGGGTGFGGHFHEVADRFGWGVLIGAEVEPERWGFHESRFQVGGQLLSAHDVIGDVEVAGGIDVDGVTVTEVGWDHCGRSGGQSDIHFDLFFAHLGGDHEKNEEQECHIDHRGELESGLIWTWLFSSDTHGVRRRKWGEGSGSGVILGEGDFARENVDDEGGIFLHFGHDGDQSIFEEEVEEHGGDTDDEATGGGDHGFADARGEVLRF